ncbi:MFS transporter [Nonomuraea sp. H19]|uniref:MFS transporter n=1 Tax=Nonomuraea sp. H19 TaxID=3452206 RepID=UPI003F8A14FE
MTTADIDSGQRAGLKEWLGLGVLVLPAMLLFMMLTILFLAIPQLAADLQPSNTQTLWIIDIYGFLMAGLLVTMGTLGDRIGHRRLLIAGAAVFAVVSLIAANTSDPGLMILWRAVLGIAAATQMPATLGLIFATFADARQRGVAVGVWAGGISVGTALGPVLGGALLEAFSWRAAFLVAVPVMVVVAIGAPLLLPHNRNPAAGRLDLFSVALSLATLLPIVFGVKELAKADALPAALAGIAIGLAFGAWFVVRQLRLSEPLLDVRLFANRTVSGALGVFLLAATALGGVYLLVTQYLQLVEGLSPLQAGLWVLPGAALLVVVSTLSPVLVRRIRPGHLIAAGLVVQVIGYLMLTQVDSAGGLPLLVAGFMVLYPAVAPSMALTTNLVVGSVPPQKAGAASGLATTCSDLGISLGIAIIGSIGAAVYRTQISDELPGGLPPQALTAGRDSIDGAVSAAQGLPAELGAAVLAPAREAFTSGLNVAAIIAAVIAGGAAVLALLRLRHVPPTGQPAQRGSNLPADHDADARAWSGPDPAAGIGALKIQSHHETRGFAMISIRRATADDAFTIHRLMSELADHQHQGSAITVSVDRLKELLTRPEIAYLIAERGGQAIGYVSWFQRISFWAGTDYLALDDLYVCDGERGHGVGEQLMRAVSETAEGKVIRWEVAESNVAAQRFYERIGASVVSKKICRWQVM